MNDHLKPGDPIYVPSSETAAAMSLGAAFVEGDGRMRVPRPLPTGVKAHQFERWTTPEAKLAWIAETVEGVFGSRIDLLNIAGMIEASGISSKQKGGEEDVVLYVPQSDMEGISKFPGISWSRRLRMYVAGPNADFSVIRPYLTASAKALWMTERNFAAGVSMLVKSRALILSKEEEESEEISPREREPDRDFHSMEDDDE